MSTGQIEWMDDSVVTGDILVKSFDFHRPIDSLGSEQEYIKQNIKGVGL